MHLFMSACKLASPHNIVTRTAIIKICILVFLNCSFFMSLLFHHLAGNTMLQSLFVKIWTSDEILSDSPGKMKWRIWKGAAGYCLKEKLGNLVYLWHLVQRFIHTHTHTLLHNVAQHSQAYLQELARLVNTGQWTGYGEFRLSLRRVMNTSSNTSPSTVRGAIVPVTWCAVAPPLQFDFRSDWTPEQLHHSRIYSQASV